MPQDFDRLLAAGTSHLLPSGDIAIVRLRQDTSLWLPSGRVIAGEPASFGGLPDSAGFVQQVPPGRYPLALVVAVFGEDDVYEIVAAARLVIRDEPAVSWELAVPVGDDDYAGYPVDGGLGGFVDAANIAPLRQKYPDDFDRPPAGTNIRRNDATAPITLTDDQDRPLLVAFSSGNGIGYYPTWVGRAADGDVACFLTDFLILTDDGDSEGDEPRP